MIILKLAGVAVVIIAICALIDYLRPPQADTHPISEESLRNILRIRCARGEE